jgi:hypothetical protein
MVQPPRKFGRPVSTAAPASAPACLPRYHQVHRSPDVSLGRSRQLAALPGLIALLLFYKKHSLILDGTPLLYPAPVQENGGVKTFNWKRKIVSDSRPTNDS